MARQRIVAVSGTELGPPPQAPGHYMIMWLGIAGIVGLIFWGTLRAPKRVR